MQARKFSHLVLGTVALSLSAASLAAQGAQGTCKINDGSPYQLAGARNYVTMAARSERPSEVPKHLANAIKVLTDEPEKIKNEVGRQYLLMRTYRQYLQREDVGYVVTRGSLGFTKNPDGMHNILLAMDSAANVIEAAMPECKATIAPYRDRFVAEVLNKAIQALQDEELDTAMVYARQSILVSPKDPRPWNVMTAVYQSRQQMDSARIGMRKVIELAGSDSVYQNVAQQHRYNLAVLTLNDAEAAQGDARDAAIKDARALLADYLKVAPGEPRATQALGRALTISGDTAAVVALYKEMIDHPDRFTALQLFEGGSNAAMAGRDDDAAKLFDAGLAKNPYHRTALRNAANVFFGLRNADRMEPVVKRLVEGDPNSPDAIRLYAGYWQLRQRAETDPAKKKAYADSTLAALKAQDELNPKIDIAPAVKTGNNFSLQGNVTNAGSKEASWTIKFELLDEKGQVVGTRDVPVGPIAAGGNMAFSVTVENPRAAAFRYAPLK